MTTFRENQDSYSVGSKPPEILWTLVRGDTSSFKVYVTDDDRQALNISDWNISMQIKRPTETQTTFQPTDDATDVLTLTPAAEAGDDDGEFTVTLSSSNSESVETGDIFDIQLSSTLNPTVWTVAQGRIEVIEDITD